MDLIIKKNFNLALDDFKRAYNANQLSLHMAINEIRGRYRRTVLGPFWATLTVGILILSLSFIYSKLWKIDVESYIPYLTSGYIVWLFILSTINEGGTLFVNQVELLKQIPFPYSQLTIIGLLRNLFIFAHHFVIFIFVCLFLPVNFSFATLLFPVGLFLLILNLSWITLILGMAGARYRDIPLLVSNLLTVLLFVTPILFKPEALGSAIWLADFNIIYHFVEVVRKPMLGEYPNILSWYIVILSLVVGYIFTFFMFAKKRSSIIFWL